VIVIDASVLVVALGDDGPDGRRARARLVGERLLAPEVVDLEVMSAWRRLWLAGRLERRRVDAALADLESLRLERVAHRPLLRRCWELRDNATVYDAAYVALAEHMESTLVTADERLVDAPGTRCEIELLA
jgi:predicted nucleic acid-binding protein